MDRGTYKVRIRLLVSVWSFILCVVRQSRMANLPQAEIRPHFDYSFGSWNLYASPPFINVVPS